MVKVLPDLRGLLGRKVRRATLEPQERQEHKDLQDPKVLKDRKV